MQIETKWRTARLAVTVASTNKTATEGEKVFITYEGLNM